MTEVYIVGSGSHFRAKARDEFGYVMGYCCGGHKNRDEAVQHALELEGTA